MAKSLIEMLSAKGVKVFSSTPLWESVGKPISTVKVGADCVVIESEKFPGSYQIVVQEGDKRVYIPLKQGVSAQSDSFTLQEFTATREWPERNISAGETRVFAI
jgi:hypothetical protein